MNARVPPRRNRFLRRGGRDPNRLARHGRNAMPQSYFALFNLEPCFALPGEQLDAAYRQLAAQVHPDRFANAAPAERRLALSLATSANEAYRTLKRPLLRAQHLLGLRGVDVLDGGARISQEFLLEQMDWRETLSDARAGRNAKGLQQLGELVRRRSADLLQQLAAQLDADGDNCAAARTVQQLMYVDKLLFDIDESHALLEA
jgi:molecular chaperone HscB